jgi:hypothetical protein
MEEGTLEKARELLSRCEGICGWERVFAESMPAGETEQDCEQVSLGESRFRRPRELRALAEETALLLRELLREREEQGAMLRKLEKERNEADAAEQSAIEQLARCQSRLSNVLGQRNAARRTHSWDYLEARVAELRERLLTNNSKEEDDV